MMDNISDEALRADPAISNLIRDRDAEGIVALLGRNNIFVSSDTERRIEALLADNLLNDSDVTEIVGGRKPEALDGLLDHLEQNIRPGLRAGRTSSIEKLEKDFDLRALGLSFKEIEELDELLQKGLIDIRDVTQALRLGEIQLLRDEIERRESDRLREQQLEYGRKR
jgi:hypothetical protein